MNIYIATGSAIFTILIIWYVLTAKNVSKAEIPDFTEEEYDFDDDTYVDAIRTMADLMDDDSD